MNQVSSTNGASLHKRFRWKASSRRALRRNGQEGAQIAEAAFVLPVLFLILMAIFWFALAFNIASTVQRAAKEGILEATRPTCAVCGNALSGAVVAKVQSALQADHLNPANLTAYTPSPDFVCNASPAPSCSSTPEGVEICTGVPLTCGATTCQVPPQNCGTGAVLGSRVSFAYRYNAPLSIGGWRGLTIPASAQSAGGN